MSPNEPYVSDILDHLSPALLSLGSSVLIKCDSQGCQTVATGGQGVWSKKVYEHSSIALKQKLEANVKMLMRFQGCYRFQIRLGESP